VPCYSEWGFFAAERKNRCTLSDIQIESCETGEFIFALGVSCQSALNEELEQQIPVRE
jgi:hypothetical protein